MGCGPADTDIKQTIVTSPEQFWFNTSAVCGLVHLTNRSLPSQKQLIANTTHRDVISSRWRTREDEAVQYPIQPRREIHVSRTKSVNSRLPRL